MERKKIRLECGRTTYVKENCESILWKLRDLDGGDISEKKCRETLVKTGLAVEDIRTGVQFSLTEKGRELQERLKCEKRTLDELREDYFDELVRPAITSRRGFRKIGWWKGRYE